MAGAEQPASLVTFSRGEVSVHSRWEFPSLADFPSSPIFVPRPGGVPGGGDGWVVVSVLSDDGVRVECFDAADVGRGPLGVLAGPAHETVPFMLHSVWMPQAMSTAGDGRERLRFADDIDRAVVERLDTPLRRAVEQVVARGR